MPVMKYSALDQSGTYQPDAMDQVEQWNANRGDQWSRYALSLMEKRNDDARQAAADDWRKEVALKQLGLQESMWKGGREDTAAARAAEADRWGKQFDYMRGRDQSADARWQTQFDEDKLDRAQRREFTAEDLAMRREFNKREGERWNEGKPMRDIEAQLALANLQKLQNQQSVMNSATGSYVPTTDRGREAFEETKAVTGDLRQAALAAKQAERAASAETAKAAEEQLRAAAQDFYGKDVSWFSGTDAAESQALEAKVEAYKQLLAQAGLNEPQIAAAVQKLLRETMTEGGATAINAGPSEAILKKFGATYR